MAWTYLLLAGLFEVAFAVALKASDGFTKLWPSLAFVLFSLISFLLLARALTSIPIGTAYAVWTGIGAVGTAAVGIFLFAEPAGALRLLFLALLITSIIGLKLT